MYPHGLFTRNRKCMSKDRLLEENRRYQAIYAVLRSNCDIPSREQYLEELEHEPCGIDERLATADDRMDAHNIVHAAMRFLSYRQKAIVAARFGLDGGRPLTFEECGRLFRITRERVRQVEMKALRRLLLHAVMMGACE